jgi:tRNA nucleotidyltransferase (CCA-adding enzyme)
MDIEIQTVLKLIESNGFEAYVIGGYVRDKLLGIRSTDIDICTNALPKDLVNIFKSYNAKISLYGAFKIITDKFHYDITTYRKELSYKGRRPDNIIYINNLLDDIKRRDFTINTICMNSNSIIIDELNGINDLNKKIIRCVGDPNTKLKEDPLRILRALRLAISLNFSIESHLLKAIQDNLNLINTLSYMRKREELDRILVSSNAIHGLKYLKKLGVLKVMEISYTNLVYVDDICGMYAELEVSPNYSFTRAEKDNINKIKRILKSGKITNHIIFKNGLYISIVAGKIMGINPAKITKMAQNLPISSAKELNITAEEIIKVLNIRPNKIVKVIQDELIDGVLDNKIRNEKDKLICYIINNRKKWILNE